MKKMKVILENNRGYKWSQKNDISFKGYLIYNGGIKRGLDAIGVIDQINNREELETFLRSVDGSFAFIVNKNAFSCAAVDISRSMPIFYDKNGKVISDSAEEVRRFLDIKPEAVDGFLSALYLAKSYVAGNNTVYEDILQLGLGQYAIFENDKISLETYYYHLSPISNESFENLKKKLTETATRSFEYLKEVIGNRPVVLSMSGGYDSRFVACMLKRVGINNVSCYTYGKEGSFEVTQSEKNAKALGFRWINIQYTDDEIKRSVDETGQRYIDSYQSHDYSAYMQNFPAVRKLSEMGWFQPNSVFLTGLCGDMPTGYYVVEKQDNMTYDKETAIDQLYELMYARYDIDDKTKRQWRDKMSFAIDELPITVTDYQSWVSVINCIYTGTCHSHAFLNMNRVHEFFGYEWLIPFWNKEWLSLWYSMPADYLFQQKIYEDWLLGDICKEFGIDKRKTVVGYSHNNLKRKIQYLGGTMLACICLNLGIPFKRPFDFNNQAPLELELWKKLKDKRTIEYSKVSIINLLTQYTLQSRYGLQALKNAKKHVISKK